MDIACKTPALDCHFSMLNTIVASDHDAANLSVKRSTS
jgi:hypothetical protein